jgi:hypothetical protein
MTEGRTAFACSTGDLAAWTGMTSEFFRGETVADE